MSPRSLTSLLTRSLLLLWFLGLFSAPDAAGQSDTLLRSREQLEGRDYIQATLRIASYYLMKDSAAEAYNYASQALELSREEGIQEQEASARNLLGYIYLHWDDYQGAIGSFLEYLRIGRELGDKRMQAAAFHGLGRAYGENGNMSQGIEAVDKGLALARELGDTSIIAVLRNSQATILQQAGRIDEAKAALEEFLGLSELMGDRRSVVYALNNLGELYLNQDRHVEAEAYLRRAMDENEDIGDAQARAATLGNLGLLNYKEGRYAPALDYLMRSQEVSKQQGFRQFLIDNYETLADVHEAMGDPAQALRYHRMYSALKDSLFNEARQQQIDELIMRYQQSEDRQRVELLEQKSKNQDLWFTILILGASLSLLVLILVIVGYRLRLQLHQREKQELSATIDEQNRELASALMQSSRLREVFNLVDRSVSRLQENDRPGQGHDLVGTLRSLREKTRESLEISDDWESIKMHFDKVHPDFFANLGREFPELTRNDLKICAYIKMNLNTKDIARLLNVSDRAVQTARYRIKKKMGLAPATDLIDYIRNF